MPDPIARVSANWNNGITTFRRQSSGSRVVSASAIGADPDSAASIDGCSDGSQKPAELPGTTGLVLSTPATVCSGRQPKVEASTDAVSPPAACGTTAMSTPTLPAESPV